MFLTDLQCLCTDLAGPQSEGDWRDTALDAAVDWTGPHADLYRAMIEPPWYNGVEPGYGESARPHIAALLELAAEAEAPAGGQTAKL